MITQFGDFLAAHTTALARRRELECGARALLSRDPGYAELTRQLAGGTEDGYGQLVIAAFTLAVRRRFAPAWQAA